MIDFRDKFSFGLPLLYHVTTPTTAVVGAEGTCILFIGIEVVVAAYMCHNPALSHASSYVT